MAYRLLTIILWPVFFIYTMRIAWRDRSTRYLLQRLGLYYKNRPDQKTIWTHCASVGEVNTYFPLHLELLKKYPDTEFVITTNTVTGANTVKRHNAERTTHCYLPIESGFAIKRFLETWQPEKCLIMETELWPLLYRLCNRNKTPINIINARLSHRTLNAKPWIKSLYKKSFEYVSNILCKSPQELENYKTLGATDNQLKLVGNLKFAYHETRQHISAIDLNDRNYCVAISTHNNEEQQLSEIWAQLNTRSLLVIIPRHPNRSEQIQKQLDSLGINYSVRSKQQQISSETQVYLADTLGELNNFVINAQFVFIGGSIISHGGQNILEPARLGKACVCGPHMFNFVEETELLVSNNACIQLTDNHQLKDVFMELLENSDKCETIGNTAKSVLKKQSDILNKYLEDL